MLNPILFLTLLHFISLPDELLLNLAVMIFKCLDKARLVPLLKVFKNTAMNAQRFDDIRIISQVSPSHLGSEVPE
jgi:hypothetical protein